MYTRKEMLIMLATGVVIGCYVTSAASKSKYNNLARRYNRLLERNRIGVDVFKEIMPQLPDDYNLSEKTMINITAFNLFEENDL